LEIANGFLEKNELGVRNVRNRRLKKGPEKRANWTSRQKKKQPPKKTSEEKKNSKESTDQKEKKGSKCAISKGNANFRRQEGNLESGDGKRKREKSETQRQNWEMCKKTVGHQRERGGNSY